MALDNNLDETARAKMNVPTATLEKMDEEELERVILRDMVPKPKEKRSYKVVEDHSYMTRTVSSPELGRFYISDIFRQFAKRTSTRHIRTEVAPSKFSTTSS